MATPTANAVNMWAQSGFDPNQLSAAAMTYGVDPSDVQAAVAAIQSLGANMPAKPPTVRLFNSGILTNAAAPSISRFVLPNGAPPAGSAIPPQPMQARDLQASVATSGATEVGTLIALAVLGLGGAILLGKKLHKRA